MTRATTALVWLALLATPATALEEENFLARPDGHAPIGVMGDHMHEKGELMLSFRWARMRMEGNRDGTRNLSAADVLAQGFMATPTDMDTDVFMLGAMFAPADWVTLMAMLPYFSKSMDHVRQAGPPFRTESAGVGDLRLTGLFRLWENERHHFHLNFGLSFPIGTTGAKDGMPTPLPFPMQIGSGAWDLIPGVTYNGHASRLSWGAQILGTVRLNENERGWAPSDGIDTTA